MLFLFVVFHWCPSFGCSRSPPYSHGYHLFVYFRWRQMLIFNRNSCLLLFVCMLLLSAGSWSTAHFCLYPLSCSNKIHVSTTSQTSLMEHETCLHEVFFNFIIKGIFPNRCRLLCKSIVKIMFITGCTLSNTCRFCIEPLFLYCVECQCFSNFPLFNNFLLHWNCCSLLFEFYTAWNSAHTQKRFLSYIEKYAQR